jgi:hypothetical protein
MRSTRRRFSSASAVRTKSSPIRRTKSSPIRRTFRSPVRTPSPYVPKEFNSRASTVLDEQLTPRMVEAIEGYMKRIKRTYTPLVGNIRPPNSANTAPTVCDSPRSLSGFTDSTVCNSPRSSPGSPSKFRASPVQLFEPLGKRKSRT